MSSYTKDTHSTKNLFLFHILECKRLSKTHIQSLQFNHEWFCEVHKTQEKAEEGALVFDKVVIWIKGPDALTNF